MILKMPQLSDVALSVRVLATDVVERKLVPFHRHLWRFDQVLR